MSGDRALFDDRLEVFDQDLNANNDLIYYQINERHLSFLRERKSYILKGLTLSASTTRNAFNIEPGVGIDADGNFVNVKAQIPTVFVADLTPGGINVVTLSCAELEHIDVTSEAFSPISEPATLVNGKPVSPRAQRGRDVMDPTNEIKPTRVYSFYIVHVETLAAYEALSDAERLLRIKLLKVVTPPLDGTDPGFVDPTGIPDPDFPTTIEWNMPPGSVPFDAVDGLDEAITDHQREAHIPFIFGDSSETSFLATINGTLPARLDVLDVDTDRSYYVAGRRFERGALIPLTVDFNSLSDPSGTYTVVVRLSSTSVPFLDKVQGVIQPFDDMPVATVVWDATLATLSSVSDVRNFLSVRIAANAFDFIAPLLGLFGTGYFVGAAQQLKTVALSTPDMAVLVSPGYGLARNGVFGHMVNLPGGQILEVAPADAFPKTENILGLTDDGFGTTSIVYTLQSNGVPPHAVRNITITTAPSIPLVEGIDYEIVNATLAQIRFFFFSAVIAGSDVTVTYEYGLPRLDIVAMDAFGNFSLVTGISEQFAVKPALPAGSYEWAVIDVPELAAVIQPADISDGANYQPITIGFNYGVNNRLGLPELLLDLTDPNGVTGAQIPSTDTLTINQRFEAIETSITNLTGGGGAMKFRWELTQQKFPITFDFLPVARANRFTDAARDLGVGRLYRFSVRYRDNIPNNKKFLWHIRVVRASNNAVIDTFPIPSNNAISADPTLGISHATTSFYDHADTDRDVKFFVCVNDTNLSKSDAADAGALSSITAELLSIHVEVWFFPVQIDI